MKRRQKEKVAEMLLDSSNEVLTRKIGYLLARLRSKRIEQYSNKSKYLSYFFQVPVDPHTPGIFDGEEFNRGARFFTHGYDICAYR